MNHNKILSNIEVATFCGQTALILKAGMTPYDGMNILLSDTSNASGKSIINSVIESLQDGNSYSESIASTKAFPEYVVHMINLGEESGNLDIIMESLALYYEREEEIQDSIRSAITYPFVMMIMMLLIIGILLSKVLPIFNQVFEQLGSNMNAFATSLLGIGGFLSRNYILFAIFIIIIVLLYVYLTGNAKGRIIAANVLDAFGPIRRFNEGVAAGRFAGGMALTLKSGMDTQSSLDIVSLLVENKNMINKINACKESIAQGSNFAEAVMENHLFNNLYIRMVNIGFKTGNIDIVMDKISKNYQADSDKRIHRLIAVIEPTLVITLSMVVGLILMSVILPLLGVLSNIG